MAELPVNPFPGMNPYLEGFWPDVHTKLIAFIAEVLSESLPEDLMARAEEGVMIDSDGEEDRYRADVAVVETWTSVEPAAWKTSAGRETGTALAEPQVIEIDPPVERWVEIREAGGRLVTVIEVLSPGNKTSEGRGDWLRKFRGYLRAGVNVVEIDLLRTGGPMLPEEWLKMLRPFEGTRYLITAVRAGRPGRREIYSCPLRERLPVIGVPLRGGDDDAALDLQPLIDRCYRAGRYWLADHSRLPGPMMAREDAAWVAERTNAV